MNTYFYFFKLEFLENITQIGVNYVFVRDCFQLQIWRTEQHCEAAGWCVKGQLKINYSAHFNGNKGACHSVH